MHFQLNPDDQLVLISRRILEAINPDGHLFGFERIGALLTSPTSATQHAAAAAQSFRQQAPLPSGIEPHDYWNAKSHSSAGIVQTGEPNAKKTRPLRAFRYLCLLHARPISCQGPHRDPRLHQHLP